MKTLFVKAGLVRQSNLTDIEVLRIFGWRVFNLPVFPDSRPGAEVSE